MTSPETFGEWLLREWRHQAIPRWREILQEARAKGQLRRARYAEWMLTDVLVDADPGGEG